MPSAIDATLPVAGTPTTASVRSNFSIAKSEITALQASLGGLSGMTGGPIPIVATPTSITSSGNLSGDVATSGLLFTTIQPLSVTHAKMVNVTAQRLIGNPNPTGSASRSEIPLGAGLSFVAGALTATSGAPGGGPNQVQFNNAGAFGGSAGATFSTTSLTSLNVALGGDSTGDMYYRNAAGNMTAVHIGSAGMIMQVVAGIPSWQTIATGGGTVNPGVGPQFAQYPAGSSSTVAGVTLSGDASIAQGGALTLANTAAARTNIGLGATATVTHGGAVINGTSPGTFILNRSATLPAAPAGVTAVPVWVIGSDSGTETHAILNDSFGQPTSFMVRRANGNLTTLTALALNDPIGQFAWRGHTGGGNTNYTGSVARLQAIALEAFTATNQGAAISFDTNAIGAAALINRLRIGSGLQVMDATGTAPTGGDKGPGTINVAQGIYVNNVLAGNVSAGAALTANQLVIGGGAQAIAALGTLGTTVQVLHGNAAGAPTWGPVNLTTDVSGVLQAAQEPAHTGDVTNTAGSLALTIAAGAVTYAKMQNLSTTSLLLGRGSASTGAPQEITLGAGLTMTNAVLSAAGSGADVYATVTAAGTNQAGATPLPTADFIEVTLGSGGVLLPAGPATPSTMRRKIRNSLATTIQVYPTGSSTINNLAGAAPFPLLANSTGYFESGGTTKWFSIP